jgi:hypothetical protein
MTRRQAIDMAHALRGDRVIDAVCWVETFECVGGSWVVRAYFRHTDTTVEWSVFHDPAFCRQKLGQVYLAGLGEWV